MGCLSRRPKADKCVQEKTFANLQNEDPSGSEGGSPPLTDEQGRCRNLIATTPMMAAQAKPRTVGVGNKRQMAELQALHELEHGTRQLDVETMLKSNGARHAIT